MLYFGMKQLPNIGHLVSTAVTDSLLLWLEGFSSYIGEFMPMYL